MELELKWLCLAFRRHEFTPFRAPLVSWVDACEREFGVHAAAKAILVDRELSGLNTHLGRLTCCGASCFYLLLYGLGHHVHFAGTGDPRDGAR